MWQVELTPFSDTDRAIATSIVDAVDDTGYLTVSWKILSKASAMTRLVWKLKRC
jgi:DNA-directed RNA polymerase specialized sigma54-like protein